MILTENFLIHKISNLVDDFNQNFHPNPRGSFYKIMFTFLRKNYLILNLNPL